MNRLYKELQELLKTSLSDFHLIKGSSLDSIWYWELEHPHQERMGDSFWRTLGYDPAEKQNAAFDWQESIHPDDLSIKKKGIKKHLLNPKHPFDEVFTCTHKDGYKVWVRCKGVAVSNGFDKPIRMIGVHSEVKEFKAKKQKHNRTREINDEFFTRMSHQIRTPLFGLIGMAENLEAQISDIALKKQVAVMVACGRQLREFINCTLNLSSINLEQKNVKKESVGLGSVMNYLYNLFLPICDEKEIDLIIDEQFKRTYVNSDEAMLIQILSNLMNYAVRCTETGFLQLECFALRNEQVKLLFTISGINTQVAKRKDIVCSEENISFSEDSGTGISSLDYVVTLTTMLGHKFELQSLKGVGTRASIVFEKGAIPNEYYETTKIDRGRANIGTLSILITDDNEINCEIVKNMLESQCKSIDFAQNGQVAIDKITTEGCAFDLILMDLNMPVRDGFSATAEIRSLTTIAQPTIIAISADVLDETITKCKQYGMDGYLAKPFSQQQLLDKITNVMTRDV